MRRTPDRLDGLAPMFPEPDRPYDALVHRYEARLRARRIGTVSLVAILALVFLGVGLRFAREDASPAHGSDTHIFRPIHGWIVYRDQSSRLMAVDPAAPEHRAEFQAWADPLAWSPAGDRLLLSDGSILSDDGSSSGPLVPRVQAGSFSPDGASVVLSSYGHHLSIASTTGGPVRTIATGDRGTFPSFPAWSPDGTRIAYSLHSNRDWAIWTVDPDGSGERMLIDLSDRRIGELANLAWSPDGTLLAFSLNPTATDARQGQVFVVGEDGSGLRAITPNDGSWGPSWSPGGDRIAFVAGGRLFTTDLLGTDVRRIAGVEHVGYHVAWNPGS